MTQESSKTANQKTVEIGKLPVGVLSPAQQELPVEVSHSLWRSLLWSYPAAGSGDYIEPNSLLVDLANGLKSRSGYSFYSFYYPANKPNWLHPEFPIKIQATSIGEQVISLLLLLPEEYRDTLVPANTGFMPAGLLASLLRELYNLRLVARTADFAGVDRMTHIVSNMLRCHPLCSHLQLKPDALKVSIPSFLCPTEYRALLFTKLAKLLEVLMAVSTSPWAAELKKTLDRTSEASPELFDIIESLVALSAKLPQASTGRVCVFTKLMWVYQKATENRQNNRPLEPLMPSVQVQFLALSGLLPGRFLEPLHGLYQRFLRLQGKEISAAELSSLPPTNKTVWH